LNIQLNLINKIDKEEVLIWMTIYYIAIPILNGRSWFRCKKKWEISWNFEKSR